MMKLLRVEASLWVRLDLPGSTENPAALINTHILCGWATMAGRAPTLLRVFWRDLPEAWPALEIIPLNWK
jgi:hypothetical protein